MRQAVNQKMRINILRLAFLALLPVLLLVQPRIPSGSAAHELIEAAGALILIAGVLGRFWAILYLGGVKNTAVMRDGPFSMTRNPLYFFSTVAAAGIGLMMGAVTFALLLGGVVGTILYLTARREAAFLRQEFGPAYDSYAARVPFFVPDPRLFSAREQAVFRTEPLRRNLFDASVFLSFIPLVELLDGLKAMIAIPGLSVW